MKKEIIIEGMSCGHCVKRVEDSLKKIDGIQHVQVNLDQAKAFIESDAEIDDGVIRESIDDAGYDVIEIRRI